jgi:hypothetical protein
MSDTPKTSEIEKAIVDYLDRFGEGKGLCAESQPNGEWWIMFCPEDLDDVDLADLAEGKRIPIISVLLLARAIEAAIKKGKKK